MKLKLMLGSIALVLGAGFVATASAQVKPEVLVKQRQAGMTMMGKYWGPLAGMPSGKAPYNAERVVANAAILETLSKLPWDGFNESTKDIKDIKTGALPAVFTENVKFKEGADAMQRSVASLAKISKGGDEASIKSAIAEVGKTCGGCHDNFKTK